MTAADSTRSQAQLSGADRTAAAEDEAARRGSVDRVCAKAQLALSVCAPLDFFLCQGGSRAIVESVQLGQLCVRQLRSLERQDGRLLARQQRRGGLLGARFAVDRGYLVKHATELSHGSGRSVGHGVGKKSRNFDWHISKSG